MRCSVFVSHASSSLPSTDRRRGCPFHRNKEAGLGIAPVFFFEATSKLRKASGLLKPRPAGRAHSNTEQTSCLQDDEGLEKVELNRSQRIKDGN